MVKIASFASFAMALLTQAKCCQPSSVPEHIVDSCSSCCCRSLQLPCSSGWSGLCSLQDVCQGHSMVCSLSTQQTNKKAWPNMKNDKFQQIWGWGKSCQISQGLPVFKALCSIIHKYCTIISCVVRDEPVVWGCSKEE